MNNQFFGQALQGLGQGLMAAGGGGWNQFAPAFSQGLMNAQNMQFDRMDREERRKLRELQEEQLRLTLEQQRTQNQDAVAMRQKYEKLLSPGAMSPNGMSQAQFGGAPQGMTPGLMQQFSPEQLEILRTLPPEQGLGIAADKIFSQPKERAGVNIGGVLVDPITGEKIADYSDVIRRNAAAGRSITNVQTNMGPTGINYGDPGQGLVWQRDQNNQVLLDERGAPVAIPFQGGPAWVKEQEAAAEAASAGKKEAASQASQQQAADIVTQDIDRALEIVDSSILPTTGLIGNMLSNTGGTASNDVRALVETVKANVGFDKLQAMRAASPTGGALGQVSDFENRNLQAVIGNLEQSQTKEQFKENLKRVKEVYLDIVHGPGNRPNSETQQKRLKYNPETGELE